MEQPTTPTTPTISELFALDPLSLTHDNIDLIIEYYRKKRLQFIAGDKTAGASAKLGEPIDLEELGL